jgi:hypothetical protein
MHLGGGVEVPDAQRDHHASRRGLERLAALQIYLPIAGSFVLTLGVLLWVAVRSRAGLTPISNLSMAFLALPLLLFGLLGLALVLGLLVAFGWLLDNLPDYADVIQEWADRVAGIIRWVADLAVVPLILIQTGAQFVVGPLRAFERNLHFRKDA